MNSQRKVARATCSVRPLLHTSWALSSLRRARFRLITRSSQLWGLRPPDTLPRRARHPAQAHTTPCPGAHVQVRAQKHSQKPKLRTVETQNHARRILAASPLPTFLNRCRPCDARECRARKCKKPALPHRLPRPPPLIASLTAHGGRAMDALQATRGRW